jgi:hypothetical protein
MRPFLLALMGAIVAVAGTIDGCLDPGLYTLDIWTESGPQYFSGLPEAYGVPSNYVAPYIGSWIIPDVPTPPTEPAPWPVEDYVLPPVIPPPATPPPDSPEPPDTTPEPPAGVLAVTGILLMLIRRRK